MNKERRINIMSDNSIILNKDSDEKEQDIIVMKQEGDKYSFYIVDRMCLIKATLKEIRQLANYHKAEISYFPTQSEAIAEMRKLLKDANSDQILFEKVAQTIKDN